MKKSIFLLSILLAYHAVSLSQNRNEISAISSKIKKSKYDSTIFPMDNPFDPPKYREIRSNNKKLKIQDTYQDYRDSRINIQKSLNPTPYLGWGGHFGSITSIDFNNDGSLFATAGNDGTVRVRNFNTWEIRRIFFGETDADNKVIFSPDGNTIVSGEYDCTIRLWNISTEELLNIFKTPRRFIFSCLAFSPDNRKIIECAEYPIIWIWDIQKGVLSDSIKILSGASAIHFLPDSSTIIYIDGSEGRCMYYNVNNHTGFESPIGLGSIDLAVSPDGNKIAACFRRLVVILDLNTERIKKFNFNGSRDNSAIRFSPDGTKLAALDYYGRLNMWDLKKDSIIYSHNLYQKPIIFSPNGNYLIILRDGNVEIRNVSEGQVLKTLKGEHTDWTRSTKFSPDGTKLATIGKDETKIWDTKTGCLLNSYVKQYGGMNYCTQFSPAGNLVASGGKETIELYNLADGKRINTIDHYMSDVLTLAYSPDGKILVSGDRSSAIEFWDVSTGKLIKKLDVYSSPVYCVKFSPDGKKIVSSYENGTIIIWDAETGNQIRTLSGLRAWVFSVSYTPDGSRIIAGDCDGIINIWEAATGNLLRTIPSPGEVCTSNNCSVNVVYYTAISTDGKKVAAGYGNGKIRIWNIDSGTISDSITFDHGFPFSVQYNNDGTKIASAGVGYNNIRIYDLKTLDIKEQKIRKPAEMCLYQNYPNPFNPSTVLSFELPVSGFVTLKVYDILGREVKTLFEGRKKAGKHSMSFEAGNLSAGTYFCILKTEKAQLVRKLLLLK